MKEDPLEDAAQMRPPREPAHPTPEWRAERRKEGKVPMTRKEIRNVVRAVVDKQFDPVEKRVCRLYMAGYWHADVCRLACIEPRLLETVRECLARDFLAAGVHLRKTT